MTPPAAPARSKQHRLPGAIIRHGLWLCSRFPLSDRDGPELLGERGLDVPHAASRPWGLQVGPDDATQRKRRRPRTGEKWHVDEVFVPINGKRPYLWRAVDQDDAAKKLCRTLLQGLPYVPRGIITDTLKSSGAAKRERLPGGAHRPRRSRHNRCAHSQRPTRQRERRMQGGQSAGHAPRFFSAYGPSAHPCRPRRHRLAAPAYRQAMRQRGERWAEMTGTGRAA